MNPRTLLWEPSYELGRHPPVAVTHLHSAR